MARIVTEETSLTRRRERLSRETAALNRLVGYEWIGAGILLVAGTVLLWLRDSATVLGLGIAGLIFAFAHGFRIRENRDEE